MEEATSLGCWPRQGGKRTGRYEQKQRPPRFTVHGSCPIRDQILVLAMERGTRRARSRSLAAWQSIVHQPHPASHLLPAPDTPGGGRSTPYSRRTHWHSHRSSPCRPATGTGRQAGGPACRYTVVFSPNRTVENLTDPLTPTRVGLLSLVQTVWILSLPLSLEVLRPGRLANSVLVRLLRAGTKKNSTSQGSTRMGNSAPGVGRNYDVNVA